MNRQDLLESIQQDFGNENFVAAEKKALEFTTTYPDDKVGFIMLGLITVQLENILKAKVAFFTAAELDEKDPEPYYHIGLLEMAENGSNAGRVFFEKMLNIDPNNIKALDLMAHFAFEQEHYTSAINYFKQIFDQGHYPIESILKCAQIYTELEAYEDGLEFLLSVQLETFNMTYTSMKKFFLLQLSRKPEALECLMQMLEVEPFSPIILTEYIELLLDLKLLDQALEASNEFFMIEVPDKVKIPAHILRLNIFQQQEKHQEALKECNAIIDYEDQVDDLDRYYYTRANLNFKLKSYKSALQDYNQAIQLDPQNAAYYNARAHIFLAAKKYDKAEADLKRTIKLDPEYPSIYTNLAKIALAKKENKTALTYLNKAYVENDPVAETLIQQYFSKQVTMLQNASIKKMTVAHKEAKDKNKNSDFLKPIFNKVWGVNVKKSYKAMEKDFVKLPEQIFSKALNELSKNLFIITPESILFFEGEKKVLEAFYSLDLESDNAALLQLHPVKGGATQTMRLFIHESDLGITYPIGNSDIPSRYFVHQTPTADQLTLLKNEQRSASYTNSIKTYINSL